MCAQAGLELLQSLGINGIRRGIINDILSYWCRHNTLKRVCTDILFFINGHDAKQLNEVRDSISLLLNNWKNFIVNKLFYIIELKVLKFLYNENPPRVDYLKLNKLKRVYKIEFQCLKIVDKIIF